MRVFYKILLSTIGWIFVMPMFMQAQQAVEYPKYQGFVNDYMKLLSITESQQLETYLVELAQSTSNEIVVATLPTPASGDFRTYTYSLAIEWGIGQEGKDNGVLLAVFPDDRKIVIEVGYGLEGAIPDLAANNIIRKDISPAFRGGSFYQGIAQGVQALGVLAKGEISEAQRKRYYAPPTSNQSYSSSQGSSRTFSRVFVIIFIIILIIFFMRGGRGNGGGGYNRGGRYRDSGGGWFIFPMGGWGSSGGSSWGGGGGSSWGDGGGFGGFGGGDFGGGGAMGDW